MSQENLAHIIDMEKYNYVFDWASLLALGGVDAVCPDTAFGLRALQLPLGCSMRTNIPGTFAVNAAIAAVDDGELGVETLQLPMLVSLKDEGIPDMIAYSFKLAGAPEPKLYVAAVPSNLKIDSKTWVSDTNDTVLYKMDVVRGFKVLPKSSGNNMSAVVDEWLKNKATLFQMKLLPKSVNGCRNWGSSPWTFEKNVDTIISGAELAFRRATKEASGASSLRGSRSKGPPAKSKEDNGAAEGAELAPHLLFLHDAKKKLQDKAPFYNLPLRYRIMDLNFSIADDKVVIEDMDDFMHKLSKEKSLPAQIGAELQQLREDTNFFRPIATHAAPQLSCSSPMLRPSTPKLPAKSKSVPALPDSADESPKSNADSPIRADNSPLRQEEVPGGLLGDEDDSLREVESPALPSGGSDRRMRPRKPAVAAESPAAANGGKQAPKRQKTDDSSVKPPQSSKRSSGKPPKPPQSKQSQPLPPPARRTYRKSAAWWAVHGAKLREKGKTPIDSIDLGLLDDEEKGLEVAKQEPPAAQNISKDITGKCSPHSNCPLRCPSCAPAFMCHLRCAGKYKDLIESKNKIIRELKEQAQQLKEELATLKAGEASTVLKIGMKELEVKDKMKDEVRKAYDEGFLFAQQMMEKQRDFFRSVYQPGPVPLAKAGAASSSASDAGSRLVSPNFTSASGPIAFGPV